MDMSRKTRTRSWKLRAGDFVIVVLVAAAAAASMVVVARAGAGEKGSLAVVEVNGREVCRVTLGAGQARRAVSVDGWQGPSTFEIEDGRIRMIGSDCRDKVCVGMGWIDTPGRSIVCLPNRVVIRVTGGRKAGNVDTVTE